MTDIFLKRGREHSAAHRHPWIFSGAIDVAKSGEQALAALAPGASVRVLSADGATLGCGWWSPASQIRVRLVTFGADAAEPDAALVRSRVGASVGRRASFFADAATNAMRLVNAESDGLPGVVADFYAGFVVCQLTSAGADARRDEIASALMTYAPFCRGVA